MNSTKNITVLLAEDHIILREGVRALLEIESDIDVVGEASTGREAVEMARKLQPDVVVMDIAMPLLNGLEATRQIRRAVPDTKVLILSAHGDDAMVENIVKLGASGYLVKQTTSHLLSEAIRDIKDGKMYFSPHIARNYDKRHHASLDRKGQPKMKNVRLSPREAEVLQLIAESEANKQIAAELGISIKTVEKHRAHLMQKLDIHDTAGLTRYAIETGVVESSVQLTTLS